MTSCAGTVVRDGGFVFAHRGNLGVLTQSVDNGAGTLALGTGPGNGVQVGTQLVEVEGRQPAVVDIVTPSGARVRMTGAQSMSAVDDAVGRAFNRYERTRMIGGAIGTVTDGVVDLATEAIDAATE